LSRRGLIAAAAGCGLAGCSDEPDGRAATRRRATAYGTHRSQYGELYRPSGTSRTTVVAIHGGYWTDGFGVGPMRPMCHALRTEGYTVWNLEYRRLGGGGGWPATFDDVAAGIDHLTTFDDVETADVRLVGHSAGGQLAVWAASRRETTPGGPSAVAVTRCVSLAGVLDLTQASRLRLGGANVDLLMGGSPQTVPDHYDQGDPTRLVPAACPVACVHPSGDLVVPREQSTAYVAAAEAVGAPVSFHEVPGDHTSVIEATGETWKTVIGLLGD
jgi:acetyl esterase/lipase